MLPCAHLPIFRSSLAKLAGRSSLAKLAGRSSLAKLAALALLLCTASRASAQTPVSFGDVISDSGVYYLAGNQSGSGSDGITIESDDVFLFLSRFTLRGDGTNYGIKCLGHDNVTIWGGRITEFGNGILITDGHECTVKDVRIDDCAGNGLIAIEMKNSWFLRLRCDNNRRNGVEARDCDESRFISILAHDNDANGILFTRNDGLVGSLGGMLGSKVRLCWAAYNGLNGIHVRDSGHHEIVKNQCVGNGEAGIRLGLALAPPCLGCLEAGLGGFGAIDNLVASNWCVFNHAGIVVDERAIDNTLTNNTALANSAHDLVDDNDAPPCENTWFLNFFLTKAGAGEDCIF